MNNNEKLIPCFYCVTDTEVIVLKNKVVESMALRRKRLTTPSGAYRPKQFMTAFCISQTIHSCLK